MTRIIDARWFTPVVIACVAFAIYSNSWHAPFVFDDDYIIENSEQIRDLSSFSSPGTFLGPRAVVNFTFALNYRFGKLQVLGYHLVNILIHCANGFMAYLLSLALLQRLPAAPRGDKLLNQGERSSQKARRKKGKDKRAQETAEGKTVADDRPMFSMHIISFFAALIFVAHPLQTQAVTYIVQRYASLAAFFYMASILFYLKARTSSQGLSASAFSLQPLFFFLSFLFGVLAFLSKQSAASLPLAIVLVEVLFLGGSRRKWVHRLLWAAPAFALFLVFILYAMGLFGGGGIGDMLEDVSRLSRETKLVSRWSYLCTQFNVLVVYLRLIVFPVGQNLDYYYPFSTGFFDGLTPLAFAFLAGLGILAVWQRRRYPLFTFALFWFFVTLSVESSIIPISDALFEHRLYLPLFGFSLLTAWIPFRFFPKRRFFAVIICASIIVSLGVATYVRNQVWKDGLTLWADVLKKSPRNPRAALNLGNALAARGRKEEAVRLYTQVLRSNPDSAAIHHNMGLICEKQGDTKGAISSYRRALQIDPGYADAHFHLANVLAKQKDLNGAKQHYYEALRINPKKMKAHINLGIILSRQGYQDSALEHLREAVRINPEDEVARNNLGVILEMKGDLEGAIVQFSEAVRIEPTYTRARYNLGSTFFKQGRVEEAVHQYRELLKMQPKNHMAHYNLAFALYGSGEFTGAVKHFKEAMDQEPALKAQASYHISRAYAREGKIEESARWLRRAVDAGFNNWDTIKADKDLDNIRGTPDYRKIMEDKDK